MFFYSFCPLWIRTSSIFVDYVSEVPYLIHKELTFRFFYSEPKIVYSFEDLVYLSAMFFGRFASNHNVIQVGTCKIKTAQNGIHDQLKDRRSDQDPKG